MCIYIYNLYRYIYTKYIYISNKLIVTVMISHLPVDTRTERKKLGPLNPGTWFLSKSWMCSTQ